MLLAKVIQCSPSVSSLVASRLLQLRQSSVKEILQKYRQFSERKLIKSPSRLLLCGTVVFKADLSVSEVASQSPTCVNPLAEEQKGVGEVVGLLVRQSGELFGPDTSRYSLGICGALL